MKNLLLLAHNKELIAADKDFLSDPEFQIYCANNENELSAAVSKASIHAFIIHIDDVGAKAYDLCRRLRQDYDSIIILVSSKGSDSDIVRGLKAGADDFLVSPGGLILSAHVKSLLSLYDRLISRTLVSGPREKGIVLDDLVLRPKARRITIGNREIPLTSKEFDLFYFLIQHPDEVFSKEQLFEQIWAMNPIGESATVTVHINRIREKISKAAGRVYKNIETIWGAGYRFHME
jgi:DNA-binding response OmpR family regulator